MYNVWTMTNIEKSFYNKIGVTDEQMGEIISRFFSILLTALISALITFLQSMLVDPSLTPTSHEAIPQAAATGAILRTLVLYWKESGTMRA